MGKELEEQYIKTHEVMRPPKSHYVNPKRPGEGKGDERMMEAQRGGAENMEEVLSGFSGQNETCLCNKTTSQSTGMHNNKKEHYDLRCGHVFLLHLSVFVFMNMSIRHSLLTIIEKSRVEAANRELSQRGISCGKSLQLRDGRI